MPTGAVFLSYASEDAAAAERICTSLRAAGIEVWLDQSELRGGEAWDRKIRKEIHDCALFIPVISANAHARDEGYFRLEWKLAADRSHLMAPDKTFLLPVVIDLTPQTDERIPDRFRELQWSRAPDGQVPSAFTDRVQRLLSPVEPSEPTNGRHATRTVSVATPASGRPVGASWTSSRALRVVVAAMLLGALAYLTINKFSSSKHPALPPTPPSVPPTTSVAPAAFSPPTHSIAVLPFVNLSGDKDQEYFSDGLTEELLNSLARINELQVAGRTSSFYFKGKDVDLGTIARKLNVAAVLEGSVRRSGNTVRITAQLINSVTDFHVWSQTYDRDLANVLRLQTEIANAVASALKVSLLGDVAARVELGGTRNPAAFDAYLRGSKAYINRHAAKDVQTAITAYSEAIRLDPNYAQAFVTRSIAFDELASWWIPDYPTGVKAWDKARADALRAVALAPDLGEGHLAMAEAFLEALDFTRASEEYERAVALASGNVQVLQYYGIFAVLMGRTDTGIAAARRAVLLDPLNRDSYGALGQTLYAARHYQEAIAAFREASLLDPNYDFPYRWVPHYELGSYEDARAICETRPDDWASQVCLAMTYDKLGRHADAESELARFKAGNPSHDDWYQYAQIYAQWGETGSAISCLDAAMRQRHVALQYVKTDRMLDPLRKEPRFQAIERALKFPPQ
jgi:TolB-like protein